VVAGRDVRTLANGLPTTHALTWSPDGSELWFSDGKGVHAVDMAGRRREVYAETGTVHLSDVATDGRALAIRRQPRAEAHIEHSERGSRRFTWLGFTIVDALSDDGRWMVFSERTEARLSDNFDLFIKDGESPPARAGEGRGLAVSRDGRFVLAVRGSATGNELVVQSVGGGAPRIVSTDLAGFGKASFLPDGSAVLIAARRAGGTPRTWKAAVSGAEGPTLLDHEPGAMVSPLSPDGQSFVSRRADDTYWRTFVDGRPSAALTLRLEAGETIPQWESPNAVFVVKVDAEQTKHFWTFSLATGARTKWKTVPRGMAAGSLPPLGPVAMSYGGGTVAFSEHRQLTQLFLVSGLR
jgi:Tol biopolymer transport system component